MVGTLDHIQGSTFHGRRGEIKNAFSYPVDYVLMDADQAGPSLRLFSKDRRNVMAVHSKDHGGQVGHGFGADWVRAVLLDRGLPQFFNARIELLAQPRIWGRGFNPVSFWLVYNDLDALRVVIAEVNNTFGERHSYICHKDDLSPITREDHLSARKIFYVSPFQAVEGEYGFRFDIGPERVGVWIDYRAGEDGVYATLTGKRQRLTDGLILGLLVRRPLGFMRVMALIYWQALRLKLKGAVYSVRGRPPLNEVSG